VYAPPLKPANTTYVNHFFNTCNKFMHMRARRSWCTSDEHHFFYTATFN
jgi:hypothetical protein